ncbi:MAG: hypothetical protein ABI461_03845 [Polyangiaceae bacterium]
MPYAFTQDVPIPWPMYEQLRAELGTNPPDGLIVHLVLEREGGLLRYVDVWESKEHSDRFMAERVHPAVDAVLKRAGISREKTGEPCQTPIEVHEVWAPRQLMNGKVV